MAKKQLKKLNQPKKYLQGGSNMGSVAMMRQNPYYLGQVEQDAAESKLEETRQQAMDVRQTAVQAKKDAEAQQKAALDQSVRAGATNLVQAAATDQKAGNLGKFMLKNPNLTTATSWAPIAASTAPTAASIGQVAPTVVNPIMTNAGGNAATQMVVGQAAPTVSTVGQTVTGTANVAGTANAVTGATAGAAGRVGLMGSNMSALGAAGIGIAANVGGQIIQKRADDNSAYTFTEKERRGNTGGSALASAGTGFGIGATVGSFVPVVGNVVGGLIGAGIGAGIGALKARKENKAAEEEAKRLQREQNNIAAAYQSANVNSSLTGMDTGFGLNSSTNMNNQFTNQYQVARLGGTTGIQEDRRTKKVPGGKIVPIEGTDAVEFIGRSHEKGGIIIEKDKNGKPLVEVENKEVETPIVMNNNKKQDYIFSEYLKLGGKSFAQRSKEILKGGGSQQDLQQLAATQEKVAGRDSKQVAAYGGFHKYLDGGVKPCPECPPGTICNPATGACVPDEETSNSYDWNATGLEGFKAGQNAATPAPSKPAGKQVSQADYDFFIREKNAKLADQQRQIAAQNGTSNAPALTQLPTPKFDPKGDMQAWAKGESKAMMDKSMAESDAYDAEKKKAMDLNMMYGNKVGNYSYDEASGYYTDNEQQGTFSSTPKRIVYKNGKPLVEAGKEPYFVEAFRESPEDVAALNKAGIYKLKKGDGTTNDWALGAHKNISTTDEEFVYFKNDPAFAKEMGYDVPGYTDPAGVKPPANTAASITDLASLDAAWEAGQIGVGEYAARRKELQPAAPVSNTTAADQTNSSATTTSNAGTPPIDQEEQDWRNHWISQGYVFNAAGEREVPAGKKLVVNDDGSEQIVDDTPASGTSGTATYTTPTGITPSGNQQSVAKTDNTVAPDGNKIPAGFVWDATVGTIVPAGSVTQSGVKASNASSNTGTQNNPANASNVQGGVGATTTDDKLVGSKTSGFLPTFENAKENPLWTKENYPTWKSDVHSAITDADRQQKIVDYLSNYKGDYSAEVQKRIKGKTGQELLTAIEKLATDGKPGIFHEAVRQALEATKPVPVIPPKVLPKEPEKPKEPEAPLPKKFEPCPPGTYRSEDGTCKDVGDVPQGTRINGSLVAGLGQLIPIGAALMNPYKIAPGIVGAPSVKGPLMPRMALNQERASAIQQNVAYKNAVLGQNAGPASLVAMQSANTKTNQQMMQIAKQEQDTNRQLAAEEGKMGMQASMFNAESQQKTQMFNKEFNQGERRYRREDILGALDSGAARIAGIVKDDRNFKAQERLATALDETGSYDRFSILEQLNREAKRKNSPYYGTTETERRRIAAAMHKELNPEGYIGMSEYNKLQEEKAKLQKERDEAEKKNQAKFGGARQYVSRLGELKGVRGTKAKL